MRASCSWLDYGVVGIICGERNVTRLRGGCWATSHSDSTHIYRIGDFNIRSHGYKNHLIIRRGEADVSDEEEEDGDDVTELHFDARFCDE